MKKKVHFIISTCTDVGNSKNINQDSLSAMVANTKSGQIAMAVICDGIGGLSCGEVASAWVVMAFKKWFSENLPQLLDDLLFQEKLVKQWGELIQEANEKILTYSAERHVQMGTTLTAILLIEGKYHIVQVGDSRAYQVTQQIQQLTKDQTLTAREVSLGHLTPEQAKFDKRKHVLLQCVGTNQKPKPEFLHGEILKEASFLLCTDGLYNRLTEQELYEKCNVGVNINQEYMETHLQELAECCKSRGEQDNISAVLIQIHN